MIDHCLYRNQLIPTLMQTCYPPSLQTCCLLDALVVPLHVDYDELPQDRLTFVEELELAWWYQYKVQYFASLIPTQKWINASRNMSVDDVVLIEYKSKSAPGTYRLGRIKQVELDDDNLVRTCTVIYKIVKPSKRNARDIFKDITSKEVRVPVQRLILILPVEEQ